MGGAESPVGWRRVASTSAAVWVGTALAFAASAVSARSLGTERYGTVILALAAVAMVATFLDLTLEEAVVHYGFRSLATGDTSGLGQLLRAALVVDAAVGVAVLALLVVVAGPVASVVSGGRLPAALVRLAALGAFASTLNGTTGATLMLAGRVQVRAWLTALTSGLRVVFVLVALRAGGAQAVLVAFAMAAAVGGAAQAAVSWQLGGRAWWSAAGPGGLRRWTPELARFGVHSSLTTSVLAVKEATVSVVLGRSAGPAAVGIFNVALLPVTAVNVFTAPFRTLVLPEQARLSAAGATGELRRSVRSWALAGLAIGVPGALAGWWALPRLLPALYSNRFAAAVGPARALLVMAVVQLLLAWTKTLPGAVGRPAVRTRVSLVDLAVTMGLVLALADRGADGAAAALSASSLVLVAVWAVAARPLLRTPGPGPTTTGPAGLAPREPELAGD